MVTTGRVEGTPTKLDEQVRQDVLISQTREIYTPNTMRTCMHMHYFIQRVESVGISPPLTVYSYSGFLEAHIGTSRNYNINNNT